MVVLRIETTIQWEEGHRAWTERFFPCTENSFNWEPVGAL